MDTKEYFQLQFAAAVHFQNFTGYEIDRDICELLTQAAFEYSQACEQRDFSAAQLALESSLSYVNTELDEEGYENYVEGFADCISLAREGFYDDDIDFENGLFIYEDEEEVEEPGDWRLSVIWGNEEMPALV